MRGGVCSADAGERGEASVKATVSESCGVLRVGIWRSLGSSVIGIPVAAAEVGVLWKEMFGALEELEPTSLSVPRSFNTNSSSDTASL